MCPFSAWKAPLCGILNRLNDGVSKSFVGGRSCATSIGVQIVSISCRTRMSLSAYFGAACKGGGAGVGNSLLIISSTDSISEGIAGIGLSSDTWPVLCTGPLSVPIRGRISGSQCLSHIRQLSTISIIGVLGPKLSKCLRSERSACPSMKRSRTICNWIFRATSINALRASVSSSIAKIDGSSPGCRATRWNWRLYSARRPGEL